MKYSLGIGEHGEESPWESLSVERGFNKEDNTLTLFLPNAYIQAAARETNAQGALESPAALGAGGMSALAVIPSRAKIAASVGGRRKKSHRSRREYCFTVPFVRSQACNGY
jgi:hypothetical protein